MIWLNSPPVKPQCTFFTHLWCNLLSCFLETLKRETSSAHRHSRSGFDSVAFSAEWHQRQAHRPNRHSTGATESLYGDTAACQWNPLIILNTKSVPGKQHSYSNFIEPFFQMQTPVLYTSKFKHLEFWEEP